MRIYLVPKTLPGKWSAWLIIAFFLLFAVFHLLVTSGQRGGATFFSNLLLTIPIFLAAICGIAAFFAGLFSVIWRRERSAFVFLSTLIGLFVLAFVLGEVLVPH